MTWMFECEQLPSKVPAGQVDGPTILYEHFTLPLLTAVQAAMPEPSIAGNNKNLLVTYRFNIN